MAVYFGEAFDLQIILSHILDCTWFSSTKIPGELHIVSDINSNHPMNSNAMSFAGQNTNILQRLGLPKDT